MRYTADILDEAIEYEIDKGLLRRKTEAEKDVKKLRKKNKKMKDSHVVD